MKKLCNLIKCPFDIEIVGIAEDSRLVEVGYLFVATKGFNVDHFDFIDDAIARGASAIITDKEISVSVPVVVVDNISDAFVKICQNFYGVNPTEFKFIGITGTDGKTTTASIIRRLLSSKEEVAYIGTNGVDILDKHYDSSNTTPCVPQLYEFLSIIKKEKCKTVVMEVSSEALLHNRIAGLKFKVICFTNITEDHLNIHGTIENYRNAKFLLVNYLDDGGHIFINGDNDNCRMLTHDDMSTFGFNRNNDFVFSNVKYLDNCVNFTVNHESNSYAIFSPFLGKYNIYNVGLAFIVSLYLGISSDVLIKQIKNMEPVAGRSEHLNFGQDFEIILDYAHTYNGILNILDSVSDYKRIITVTGAAGGREKEKRSQIGKLVLEKSDLVIFTMDDPRNEDVDLIIDDMLRATTNSNYELIIDRKAAIYRAFNLALSGDVVLILGKGRDNYMAIGNEKIPYCDYDVIAQYFA